MARDLGQLTSTGILAISFAVAALAGEPTSKVVFLDVGQGDSILLQDGMQQILIDGGKGDIVLERLAEEVPYFDRSIEVIISTHPDQDHLEGLLHILQRYDVKLVLLPQAAKEDALQEAWLNLLHEKNIPYRFAWSGQTLSVGNMKLSILGPFDTDAARAATRGNINNASVSTRLDYNGLSFLLTGDAELQAEQLLVHTLPLQLNVDILKAGHHGSNSSTHTPLIRAASPAAAVISVGADNTYGHPHPAVLQRLEGLRLWRTDEDGSVRFLFKNGQWLSAVAK
ncbi:MAG: MBL fold metallo-hydrolase [Candidatus Andersenbacteria bacterium]|nr:MBL fold metallo-hydrolase [Candidatus Andersenbacteria bacterium]MBI3251027.1 MBL fold metallo-hydrolase [Candidatus Andersenbacteria bacterium]